MPSSVGRSHLIAAQLELLLSCVAASQVQDDLRVQQSRDMNTVPEEINPMQQGRGEGAEGS